MTIYLPELTADKSFFPDVSSALQDPDGLLAMGGDLSAERIITAYSKGIFPWYGEDQPILWWSPDPRTVLFPARFKVSRSLRKTLRKGRFQVTMDCAFADVIHACAAPRRAASGTWITRDMAAAYTALHHRGHAHSVECWLDEQLAGGIYGVAIGKIFFGESMFSKTADASKVALAYLCNTVKPKLIDVQVYSRHMERMGAEMIPRARFIEYLNRYL